MKIEQSLKLVSVTKPNQQNPVVHRRERLITSINKQLDLIDRYRCGEKVRGLWWWIDESGTVFLPIKYGKTVLELSKGKFSIECSSIEEVEDNLEKVKDMSRRGLFDEILKTTSETLRLKFKK